MEPVSSLNNPAIIVLFSLLFVVACLQTLQTSFFVLNKDSQKRRFDIAYEVSLCLHLALMCGYVASFSFDVSGNGLDLAFLKIRFSTLLWLNVYVCLVGLGTCIYTKQFRELPVLLIVCACAPLVYPLPAVLVLADTAVLTFRTFYFLIKDYLTTRFLFRRIAMASMLDKLPEGVLYFRPDGRAVYVNDTMRLLLASIDISADLVDGRVIWRKIERRSSGSMESPEPDTDRLRVDIAPERTWLFKRQRLALGGKPCSCIIAYDIAEEERIRKSLAETNRELERTRRELAQSMNNLADITENEAMLRMRSHVHDIVGQRLSILHRYLEDDELSDETVKQITPLLTNMLDELALNVTAGESLDQQSLTLENVVNAFGVIGITYSIEGNPPTDAILQNAVARVVREASTNAVRHGQATHMSISFEYTGGNLRMRVSNNGSVPASTPSFGSGLRGMNKTVTDLGGHLAIETDSTFTIVATIPLWGSNT